MLLPTITGSFQNNNKHDYANLSQVERVVKNPPANSGYVRDAGLITGSRISLEKEMATHSSILAGESHGQRTLRATVHRVAKGRTWLSTGKTLIVFKHEMIRVWSPITKSLIYGDTDFFFIFF